jgi:hypothetical protein
VSYEHGNEPAYSVNGREFINKLSDSSFQSTSQYMGFGNNLKQVWICMHAYVHVTQNEHAGVFTNGSAF